MKQLGDLIRNVWVKLIGKLQGREATGLITSLSSGDRESALSYEGSINSGREDFAATASEEGVTPKHEVDRRYAERQANKIA